MAIDIVQGSTHTELNEENNHKSMERQSDDVTKVTTLNPNPDSLILHGDDPMDMEHEESEK